MTPGENKQVLRSVYAALADGDSRPFVDAMAHDFTWLITGQHPWADTWRGKTVVREQLLAPLIAQFGTRYRNHALRFIADGDTVAVECRGEVTTKAGVAYNNQYCNLIRMRDGQMVELVEYMDTDLCNRVLTPPSRAESSTA